MAGRKVSIGFFGRPEGKEEVFSQVQPLTSHGILNFQKFWLIEDTLTILVMLLILRECMAGGIHCNLWENLALSVFFFPLS